MMDKFFFGNPGLDLVNPGLDLRIFSIQLVRNMFTVFDTYCFALFKILDLNNPFYTKKALANLPSKLQHDRFDKLLKYTPNLHLFPLYLLLN